MLFKPLNLVALLLAPIALVLGSEEPAFPTILNALQPGQDKVHIVAESISDDSGYETIEELTDMKTGRYAQVKSNKIGRSVTFSDASLSLIYRYKPFSCEAISFREANENLYQGLFNSRGEITSTGSSDIREMHTYGLTALWFNVAKMKKTYSRAKLMDGGSQEVASDAHKWTVADESNKNLVHMYFVENKQLSGTSHLSLEMVQIISSTPYKTLTTFNVLTLEYTIPDEYYESLLQVPVGYGCMDSKTTQKADAELPKLKDLYIGPLLSMSHRVALEATGTSFTEGNVRTSDTISYELARTQMNYVETVQLIRQRDTRQDIKTILNYDFNVQFKIDMRSGSCTMSNIGESKGRGERVSLKFNNALELDMDVGLMHSIFADTTDFYFIKRTNRSTKNIEYLYYERTSSDLFGQRLARIVRTYSFDTSNPLNDVKLESVTIWVFNEKVDRIVESYHLNVVEALEVESLYEIAKVFDLSDECYLNNDQMKAGRDYAWIELTYPLDARHSQAVAAHTLDLKDAILTQLSRSVSDFTVFMIPRLEFMFEDTALVLRMLMLDLPPLELIYDHIEETSLATNEAMTEGTLASQLAIDVAHCADQCRLTNCPAMTFCDTSHRCLLSTKLVGDPAIKLIKGTSCTTYVKPQDTERKILVDDLLKLRLHQVISTLQHQAYGSFTIPRMPDELALPPSETGVDTERRRDILLDYLKEVWIVLQAGGDRLPSLTFNFKLDEAFVMLVPSKFELEQDPLSEFGASDAEPESTDVAPLFHEGLSMRRFKINSVMDSKNNWGRLFTGLTYDQCVLACLDGTCSSFSYCSHRQECIVTKIYTIAAAVADSAIEQDADCFISQRDFITKFNKFQNVREPQEYKRQVVAFNPSECAHSCLIEENFRCLAFDFCVAEPIEGRDSQLGKCFLLEERLIYAQATDAPTKDPAVGVDSKEKVLKPTGCDHYSRSYLADFHRVEYREIESSRLETLKTSLLEGQPVDKCADICVNQLADCTAFQFCFDPDSKGPMQKCTLIESQPEGDAADFELVFNGTSQESVVRVGKYFAPNQNCHIFSLRRDCSEAHLRDLAFKSQAEVEQEASSGVGSSAKGLSLGGGIMLYICMTVFFAAVGCGFVFVKHQNPYVRSKIERFQLLLGVRKH